MDNHVNIHIGGNAVENMTAELRVSQQPPVLSGGGRREGGESVQSVSVRLERRLFWSGLYSLQSSALISSASPDFLVWCPGDWRVSCVARRQSSSEELQLRWDWTGPQPQSGQLSALVSSQEETMQRTGPSGPGEHRNRATEESWNNSLESNNFSFVMSLRQSSHLPLSSRGFLW